MRLLVLGGTLFVGRHLVEAALDRGHEVTLFNRGRTNTDLFPKPSDSRATVTVISRPWRAHGGRGL